MRPEITVLMAEYSTNPIYLHNSIKSILNQTFHDFEFIIVDDCGANDVEAIARKFNNPRIRIIKNENNVGLANSLNIGLKHARGQYIARMDTDDIAHPERLQKLYSFIQSHPEYDAVGSRAIEFSGNQEFGILGKMGEKNTSSLLTGDVPVHPSVILRTSAIRKVGGYPTTYRRAEDLALWCELLLHQKRIYVMEDLLLRYRVNPNDYKKRSLKNRIGELKARFHYYPRLKADFRDYTYICRSIAAGAVPRSIARWYHNNQVLTQQVKSIHETKCPLISIIIPVYNSEIHINACIKSVTGQTYDNLQIILIDDGSTDHSGELCAQYELSDNRIEVVHQKNNGVSSARNLGLRRAKGSYVIFVDSDDIIAQDMVDILYRDITKYDSSIAISSMGLFHGITDASIDPARSKEAVVLSSSEATIRLLYGKDIGNGVFARMYERSILHGIIFPIEIAVGEDLAFSYNALRAARKVSLNPSKLYFYRQHKSSVMSAANIKKRLDVMKVTTMILDDKTASGQIKKAAYSKEFAEAVSVLSHTSWQKQDNTTTQLKNLVQKHSYCVATDHRAKITHRFYALLAIISPHLLLYSLKIKQQLRHP